MDTTLGPAVPAHGVRPAAAAPRPDRIESIDRLRGLVMVIMALDHVRDFFSERLLMDPTNLATTTTGIFLTRWVTHFCAPTFIFLAGTSAYLAGTRGKSKPALSWFLFTRGLWLAFFEVVINRMMWMFNFDLRHHGAGVFWAIGWSMVALSVLVYLPTPLVALAGVLTVALHNTLDGLTADRVALPEWLWVILHSPGKAVVLAGRGGAEDFTFETGYCLIPWAGVMAAGYGCGALFLRPRAERRRTLALLGAALTLAFVALRAANGYGDPRPWEPQPTALRTFLSFLNCTKYPASLLYLLMTLGPAILALAAFDTDTHGSFPDPVARPLVTFGRVPLFYYVLHILLIHGGAVLLDYVRFGWSPLAGSGPWFKPEAMPANYGVGLPAVYLIWAGVVLALYPPCRWFAGVKRRRRDAWLSYL